LICILYVNLFGALLGLVGVLTERILPAGFSRRWMWCAIIAVSIVVPGYNRFHHNVAVSDVLGAPSATHGPASFVALDPTWWAHTESYDNSINQLWMISSVALILWGVVGVVRVAYLVHNARRRARKGAPTIVDGVPVVVTDSLGPATAGLLRSRVLVPRWVLALSGAEQRYIIRHEEEHRRAHDAHLLFITSLPILLVPWNLALWWQVRRMCLAVETDCDNRVVARLGDPGAYGELLLKVAESASRGPRLQPALLGGMGSLEHRLTVLLAPTPLRHVQRFLLPAMAIALLVLTLSLPHPVVHHAAHGKDAVAQTAVGTSHSSE
jgi:bla regulator protein blaR1